MDSSIRPIDNQPAPAATPVHRRREGEATFDIPESDDESPKKNEDATDDEKPRDGDRPVAPPLDDEAGGQLDITA
jgi:hypothetical protein